MANKQLIDTILGLETGKSTKGYLTEWMKKTVNKDEVFPFKC